MLITPLHLRALLDHAREKILEDFNCASWEDLLPNKGVRQLANDLYNQLSSATHHPSVEAVYFLCAFNSVRRAGNSVAHNATQEDMRVAVTTQRLGSDD